MGLTGRHRYPGAPRRGRVLGWLTAAVVVVALVAAVALVSSRAGGRAVAMSSLRPAGDAAAPAAPGPVTAGETPLAAEAPVRRGKDRPPIARASGGSGGLVGRPVAFSSDGSSDPEGGPLSYRWSFGDGTFVTEASPVHTFEQAGTFRVTLTVTDAAGSSAQAGVVVQQQRPTAPLAMDSRTVAVPSVGGTTSTRIWWNGQRPNTAIFAKVCRRPSTDPAFREGVDCSILSEVTANGTSTGSGWIDVPVFRGPEPGGDGAWGCFAPGDPAPPGIQKLTTCYIRLTNNVGSNTRDDRSVPFTVTS